MKQYTVRDLQQYWNRPTSNGEVIYDFPLLHQMPPWNDICSQLHWELHLVEGGYFRRKHHGYYGVYRIVGLAVDGDITKPAVLSRICGQDATGTLYVGESLSL